MIVRTWHGCVPQEHGDAFAVHLKKTGVQHAQNVSGNCGAFVKRVDYLSYAHFFLATYWESLNAVKLFAGADYTVAVHYPDDDTFQLIADPYVFHHSVCQVEPL